MKGWAATLHKIAASDHRLMRKANRWRAPRWIRLWMICATRGGDGWLWYAMALVILAFGGPQGRTATEAAGAAATAGIVLFLILKRLANRPRPGIYEPHCWATLLPPDRFSFPSGHTITAFAVAVPLGLFYPSLLFGLLFCALSVAVSRILLGLHFLSDVVAGASLGVSLGFLAFLVFR